MPSIGSSAPDTAPPTASSAATASECLWASMAASAAATAAGPASPSSCERSTPRRRLNHSSAASDGGDLPSSTWLTYSLLKRSPPRPAWVRPAATRSSRTRLPIPDAGAAPLERERCVVAAVVPLPMPLTLAHSVLLDQPSIGEPIDIRDERELHAFL